MTSEIEDLLYGIPSNGPQDVDDLTDLEVDDILHERIPEIEEIMLHCANEYYAVRAGIVLACWGQESGFNFLGKFVCDRPPSRGILMPHRLRNYDDVYTQVLMAIVSYWAVKSDAGAGAETRGKIFKPISRIIDLSNELPFEIVQFYWLVEKNGFIEYLPSLKEHLACVLRNPAMHHWKTADCANLLMKFDPSFVTQELASHGKTLADFPSK
jgi:hypothetical protein